MFEKETLRKLVVQINELRERDAEELKRQTPKAANLFVNNEKLYLMVLKMGESSDSVGEFATKLEGILLRGLQILDEEPRETEEDHEEA